MENGWKVIKHLEKSENTSLAWKSAEDWARYYKDRIVSKVYSEKEYVANMVRKRDDGFIDGNVFSLFCIENENESWYDWEAEHEPLGTVKIKAKIKDANYSIVRPGFYELEDSEILEGYENVPIKKIVTWARPFSLQAKDGEEVEACGLLEKVKSKEGEFYQLVIGYFDTYTSDRGEKEYLKALIE
jgi:predicted nucleotidyltransferase